MAVIQRVHSVFLTFDLVPLKGGRSHHVADPLDAPRKHHVQEVHHWERRLESGSGALGNIHLRETALVSALQQWGTHTNALMESV